MLIVELNGGLGNQMFQYALYTALKAAGKDAYIFDSVRSDRLNNNKSDKIYDIFTLNYQIAPEKIVYRLADVNPAFLSKARRKIIGKKNLATNYIETDFDDNYDPKVFLLDTAYIQGYWQSEKYFKHISEKIRADFSFNVESSPQVREYENKIKSCESVSIHLRRGDYINNPVFKKLYGDICTDEYYINAVKVMKEKIDNPRFFVFSDDIDGAKQIFKNGPVVFVEGFRGKDAHYDMYLMSCCKYNVIANSSFSWWGAWLNTNEDKIVIGPKKWMNSYKLNETPCVDWILI